MRINETTTRPIIQYHKTRKGKGGYIKQGDGLPMVQLLVRKVRKLSKNFIIKGRAGKKFSHNYVYSGTLTISTGYDYYQTNNLFTSRQKKNTDSCSTWLPIFTLQ
jgi:hypothetical protein